MHYHYTQSPLSHRYRKTYLFGNFLFDFLFYHISGSLTYSGIFHHDSSENKNSNSKRISWQNITLFVFMTVVLHLNFKDIYVVLTW